MANSDYNEFIQRVLRNDVYDTVYKRRLDTMKKLFPNVSPVGGDRITEKFETARSSPAASYTKADVDPAAASNTLCKPYWTKVFYHTACEIEGIDISNAKNGGTDLDLVSREINQEALALEDIVFTAMFTQLKADIDSSGTAYSDGSLSRSTHASLASYEETTNAAITIAYFRGMVNGTTLLKNCGPLSGYVCLMEQAVYNVFKPLAAALHTLNTETRAGVAVDQGYPDVANFEGVDIVDPRLVSGMTTGEVYLVRKQDIKITEHRPLEIEQVPSGRDSVKFVLRWGINMHAVHPGFQGKMLDKD